MNRLVAVLLVIGLLAPIALSAKAQPDDTTVLVEGSTGFAFDLYAALRESADGNLLFSPFSVSQALAMTYTGAEGHTRAQMAEVLGFDIDGSALNGAFSQLTADLTERGTAPADPDRGEVAQALHVANGLWGEQTFPFSDAFLSELSEYYGAGLQETDFINAPEDARDEINGWVEEQTENRIQDIVPEGAIDSATRLVLANAIYFYGGWAETFDAENTSDEDFHLLDGSTVTVPLMFQHESYWYTAGDGFQIIEIPYARSGLAFTVILPDEGAFESVESELNAAALGDAVGQVVWTDIELYLPSFEFEFTAGLGEILQSMGMTDAFDPGTADFSGMVDGDVPDPLFIGDVLHKAFISVDEDGTEAAAATAVLMLAGSAPGEPAEPIEVRIDRPFIFAIRDVQTGTILFLGRVLDPRA